MNKAKELSAGNVKKQIFSYTGLGSLLIILFLLLEPKIIARMSSHYRQIILNHFIQSLQTKHTLDAQKFWEFREFYSPGYFIFRQNGLGSEANRSLANNGISLNTANSTIVFSRYSSQQLTSSDSLISNSSLDTILSSSLSSKIISKGSNYILYQENLHILTLVFLMPTIEMEKANGFFDSQEIDKSFLNGKYWLDITTITIN